MSTNIFWTNIFLATIFFPRIYFLLRPLPVPSQPSLNLGPSTPLPGTFPQSTPIFLSPFANSFLSKIFRSLQALQRVPL
jgi:hypothetical protein